MKLKIVGMAYVTVLLLGMTACGSVVSASSPQAQTIPTVTPTRADHFLDSLGINTHVFYTTLTGYATPATVESSLSYLGFRYMRDGAANLSASNISRMADITNATGVKYDFTLNSGGTVNLNSTFASIHSLLAVAPHSIASMEGSNEINNIYHATAWAVSYNGSTVDMCAHSYAPVVAAQQDFYSAVHADTLLTGVPVYNFTVVNLTGISASGCTGDFTADLSNIGDMSAYVDYKNIHHYPYEGTAPGADFQSNLTLANPVHGKPTVVTELGYTTGIAASAVPYLAVDETVQAKFSLDAMLDLYKQGVSRSYLYELMDEMVDTPATNAEYHYGLFHFDGSPKPAATGFHNLIAILQDAGASAASFTPSAVGLSFTQSISGTADRDANTYSLLLQKSNGTNEFIVWGEPAIWNAPARAEYPIATSNNITISFGTTYSNVKIYDVLSGSTPTSTLTGVSSASISVTDHPVVVEFY